MASFHILAGESHFLNLQHARIVCDAWIGFGQGQFVEIFSQQGIFTLSFCCFYPVLGRGGCRLLFAQASRQTQFGWRLMCSPSRAGAFLVIEVALLHQRFYSVESGTSFIEKVLEIFHMEQLLLWKAEVS